MKYLATAMILAGSIALTACVPSIHPLYTAQDVVFDDSLVGAWVDLAADETWILSKAEKGEYKLIQIAEDGSVGEFSAKLVRIGTETFVDMAPVKSGFLKDHFLATHTFVHLMKNGDRIHVSVLEPKWIKETLAERPQLLSHEKVDGETVLTALPKDLQTFLLANLKTRGAFTEATELTRKHPRRSQ